MSHLFHDYAIKALNNKSGIKIGLQTREVDKHWGFLMEQNRANLDFFGVFRGRYFRNSNLANRNPNRFESQFISNSCN